MYAKDINPFVKWAGGKRQVILDIERRLPNHFNHYYEPFVGGGAVFMHLKKQDIVINDYSQELINTYLIIKNQPYKLMDKLDEFENNHRINPEEYYYKVRGMDRDFDILSELSDLDKAARFIYLNKTCFNGLYRINSKGQFNVPFNKKEKVNTYNRNNIINLSEYLNNHHVKILNGDFEASVIDATKGDFIYFDPPYDLIKKDTFDSYTIGGFGVEGQKRLAQVFKNLHKKGCYVMLSNHDTPLIRELYQDFKIDTINVKRMINSDAKNRNGEEVIIYNY